MYDQFLKKVKETENLERLAWKEGGCSYDIDLTQLWYHDLQKLINENHDVSDILFKILVEDVSAPNHTINKRDAVCLSALCDLILQGQLSIYRCQTQFLAIQQVTDSYRYSALSAEFIRVILDRIESMSDSSKVLEELLLRVLATDSTLLHHTVVYIQTATGRSQSFKLVAHRLLSAILIQSKSSSTSFAATFSYIIPFIAETYKEDLDIYISPTFLLTSKVAPTDLVPLARYSGHGSALSTLLLTLSELADFTNPLTAMNHRNATLELLQNITDDNRNHLSELALLTIVLKCHGEDVSHIPFVKQTISHMARGSLWWVLARSHLRSLVIRLTANGESTEELAEVDCIESPHEMEYLNNQTWEAISPYNYCSEIAMFVSSLLKIPLTGASFSSLLRSPILSSCFFAILLSAPDRLKRTLCMALAHALEETYGQDQQTTLPTPTTLKLVLLPYLPILAKTPLVESARVIALLAYTKSAGSFILHACEKTLLSSTISCCSGELFCDVCAPHVEQWPWHTPEYCVQPLSDSQKKSELGHILKRLIISDILPLAAITSKMKSTPDVLLPLLNDMVEQDGPKIWTWLERGLLQELPQLPPSLITSVLQLVSSLIGSGCIGKEACHALLSNELRIASLMSVETKNEFCHCVVCKKATDLCDGTWEALMHIAGIIREYIQGVVLESEEAASEFTSCLTPFFLGCFNMVDRPATLIQSRLQLCGLYATSSLIARSHGNALSLMDTADHEPFLGDLLGDYEFPQRIAPFLMSSEFVFAWGLHRQVFSRQCDSMLTELFEVHAGHFGRTSSSQISTRHPMLSLLTQFLNPKGRYLTEEVQLVQKSLLWNPEGVKTNENSDQQYSRRNHFLTQFKALLQMTLPQLLPFELTTSVHCPSPQAEVESWELCLISGIMLVHTVLLPLFRAYLDSCPLAVLNSEIQTLLRFLNNRLYFIPPNSVKDAVVENKGPDKIDPLISLQRYLILLLGLSSLALAAPTVHSSIIHTLLIHVQPNEFPPEIKQWVVAHSYLAMAMIHERYGGVTRSWKDQAMDNTEQISPITRTSRNYLFKTFIDADVLLDTKQCARWYGLMTEESGLAVIWKSYAEKVLLDNKVSIEQIHSPHYDCLSDCTCPVSISSTWEWIEYALCLRNSPKDSEDFDAITKIRDVIITSINGYSESFASDLGIAILLGIPCFVEFRQLSLSDPQTHYGWSTGALMSTIGLAMSTKDKTPLGKKFLAFLCDNRSEVINVSAMRHSLSILLVGSILEALRNFECNASVPLGSVLNSSQPYNLVALALNKLMNVRASDIDMASVSLLTNILARITINTNCSMKLLIEGLMRKTIDWSSSHPSRGEMTVCLDQRVDEAHSDTFSPDWYTNNQKGAQIPPSQGCVLTSVFAFAANLSITDITVANVLLNLPQSGWWSRMRIESKLHYISKTFFSSAVVFDKKAFSWLLALVIHDIGLLPVSLGNNEQCLHWNMPLRSFALVILIRSITSIIIAASCTGTLDDSADVVAGHYATIAGLVPPGWRSRLKKTWVSVRGNDQLLCGIKELNRIALNCFEKLDGLLDIMCENVKAEECDMFVENTLTFAIKALHDVDLSINAKETKNESNLVGRLFEKESFLYPYLIGAVGALGIGSSSRLFEKVRLCLCNGHAAEWNKMCVKYLESLLIFGDDQLLRSSLISTLNGMVAYDAVLSRRLASLLWMVAFKGNLYRLHLLNCSAARYAYADVRKAKVLPSLSRWSNLTSSLSISQFTGDDQFLKKNQAYADDIIESRSPVVDPLCLRHNIWLRYALPLEPLNQLIKSQRDADNHSKATAFLRKVYRVNTHRKWTSPLTDFTKPLECLPTRSMLIIYCEANANQWPDIVARLRMTFIDGAS